MNNKAKSILGSIMVVAVAAALLTAGTQSQLGDSESSVGNLLVAGELDLKVDFEGYYNKPVDGIPNAGSWSEKNLTDDDKFFNLLDVKPGDYGEGTISLHLYDNDGYLWMQGGNLVDSDGVDTEPELQVDPTPGAEGELAENTNITIWWDYDGDNVRDGDQPIDIVFSIDASGSMYYEQYGGIVDGRRKIEYVEDGVTDFLDRLRNENVNATVGLVFFDGFMPDNGVGAPQLAVYSMEDVNALTLPDFSQVVLDLTNPNGAINTGTALPEGINRAQKLLDDEGRPGTKKANIILTDGEPWKGGSLPNSRFDLSRQAADDGRDDLPSDPPTDVYVIGCPHTDPRADDLIEDMAGPAGTSHDDGPFPGYYFNVVDCANIEIPYTVFVYALAEKIIFEGKLDEAMAVLSAGDGIPLDGFIGTVYDHTVDPEDDPDRDPFTACRTYYIGVKWWIPFEVGNVIQGDTATFDLGFYTQQARNNDGIGPYGGTSP